jgi:glycosyltransferase involved in cell wall biosynthesis
VYHARAVVSPGKVGLTAIHALAYGTPVITHANFDVQRPEFEAILPGQTGDFFPEGDVDELAQVLTRWLDTPRSEDERRSAVASIEANYTPKRQVELIEAALSRLFPRKASETAARNAAAV